ncbi:DUF1120 domain-containing protein [Pseudomonas sp. 14P_8.1_Bac3]|uniref:DUF1120 domain-containing protein n=1 Tax=Pseudomonas sp. 14P_8.1_Bac3 TaxID=2971621 RepID=UPI0021C6CDD7|nr:DUF1120 domain-containing protein [Pseudomonas sp. 14P_8.1_Bac3]MCU1760549.1 DUF1120 domain-containing protein [Pseudomonas sp. 14P_8.1_Bac3]
MNTRLSLLTAALLLTGASSAFAASSTDLSVTGTITPSACSPELTNGGMVDYGKISAKDLDQAAHTQLGEQTLQLTVTCDASTPFAISMTDNRPGTSSDPNAGNGHTFGLGLINGGEKLGWYSLFFRNPVADIAVRAMFSEDKGNLWHDLSAGESVQTTDWVAFGNNRTPESLQAVTVDLALQTAIAPASGLTLTDEVAMDGSATLQIEYL